ncbi:hypothetical protein BJV74DRAFT_413038 [Russula compacta]|nr:hypothetical protein BJV74DRAFT_413038 [Russula compacta]
MLLYGLFGNVPRPWGLRSVMILRYRHGLFERTDQSPFRRLLFFFDVWVISYISYECYCMYCTTYTVHIPSQLPIPFPALLPLNSAVSYGTWHLIYSFQHWLCETFAPKPKRSKPRSAAVAAIPLCFTCSMGERTIRDVLLLYDTVDIQVITKGTRADSEARHTQIVTSISIYGNVDLQHHKNYITRWMGIHENVILESTCGARGPSSTRIRKRCFLFTWAV